MSRKENALILVGIFTSLFLAIFSFHLLTWLKAEWFFSKKYLFFSTGENLFIWMIGLFILLFIGVILWVMKRNVQYIIMIIVLFMVVSFLYVSSYIGVTNEGFEVHYLFMFQKKVTWKQIKNIKTDYQINDSKGKFSPRFLLTLSNGEQVKVHNWENIWLTKPPFSKNL